MIKKFEIELDNGATAVISRSVLQKWFLQCEEFWFTKDEEHEMKKHGEWFSPNVAGIASVSSAKSRDKEDILDVDVFWPLGKPEPCYGDERRMPTARIVWRDLSSVRRAGYTVE